MLTPRALAMLNGFNSRQLHRITGRSYRDEATTPSYDLLKAVRTRRHQWLGHILRMPSDRLLRRAVLALGQQTALSTWQPLDGHALPRTRTNHASRRPPRMSTRQPIPLLPTGKPLRGENSKHHHHVWENTWFCLFLRTVVRTFLQHHTSFRLCFLGKNQVQTGPSTSAIKHL